MDNDPRLVARTGIEPETPETLRPVADVGEDEAAPTFVKPVRWPLIIGVGLASIVALGAIVVAASRATQLAGVQATLAAAEQRAEAERRANAFVLPSSFDEKSAVATLESELPRAGSACGIRFNNGADVDVRATFAPDGHLSSASIVSAPFAGTPLGNCIASKLSPAHVAGFGGKPITIERRLVVH